MYCWLVTMSGNETRYVVEPATWGEGTVELSETFRLCFAGSQDHLIQTVQLLLV